jgi:hypothetical protein
MNIEETLKFEQERNIYLQWKSDCWRNITILLVESIKSGNTEDVVTALAEFEMVKKMFPYKVF